MIWHLYRERACRTKSTNIGWVVEKFQQPVWKVLESTGRSNALRRLKHAIRVGHNVSKKSFCDLKNGLHQAANSAHSINATETHRSMVRSFATTRILVICRTEAANELTGMFSSAARRCIITWAGLDFAMSKLIFFGFFNFFLFRS